MGNLILNTSKNITASIAGGKAYPLFLLKEKGWSVPDWVVIPHNYLSGLLPDNSDSYKEIRKAIENIEIPALLLKEILDAFQPDTFFAVRSNSGDEDGVRFSFAGQFESSLFVTAETLSPAIKKVWQSAYSDRVKSYRNINGLSKKVNFSILIQKMIDSDVSGVAFGINPVTGDRNEKIITAVPGLGEGLVSGELNSDTYSIKNGKISIDVAHKTHKVIRNKVANSGTYKTTVSSDIADMRCLKDTEILEIGRMLDACRSFFGRPQDIEFSIAQGNLYILQSRPITNLDKIPDTSAEYTLWDNSNIIESYPGVTTPLTFSFISKSYEGAYKLFSTFLGVGEKVIKENERVFANTLGFINGRVYYNLKSWYHMLAMLPGYSINARYMEKMMGVKEQFDIPHHYKLSKTKARWIMIKILIKMIRRHLSLPHKRREFSKLLNSIMSDYSNIQWEKKSASELMNLYLDFEKKLLNEWKAPLLNDFFAMIWFGLLQNQCMKSAPIHNQNIHNDLLCGSADIISTKPIHRTVHLAASISNDPVLKELFLKQDENTIWTTLSTQSSPPFSSVKLEIDLYLQDFGERCSGELKLETISYSQDPTKFMKVLKAYVSKEITKVKNTGISEDKIRNRAEIKMRKALEKKPMRWWLFKKILRTTRELVSARENLRYERTRTFGVVRKIFTAIGQVFYSEGIITDSRDIFFLTKEEIFSYIEGRTVTCNIVELIALRKNEFEKFENTPSPVERFPTYGIVYHANDFYPACDIQKFTGDLKGIGCSPGRVKGNVKVILNPDEINSLNGDILVTSSTDPGWVTLFPTTSAIIVERGSLLSHSAIVAREMGIPCIVGVTGLLKTLKTGNIIEMNGATGEIKIIQSKT